MIEVFEGKLGGGKSYSATVRAVRHLAKGGIVATNIQLNKVSVADYIRRHYKVEPDLDRQLFVLEEHQVFNFEKYIPRGKDYENVPLVIIDEFHLWFNNRDWAQTAKNSRPTLTFITQSRKLHVDLILISQSVLNMDKQFMRMVQYIWRFRDLDRWKIPGLGINYSTLMKCTLGIVYPHQILVCQFDMDGRTLLDRKFVKKDPEIFKLYETNSLLRPIDDLSPVTVENLKLQRYRKPTVPVPKWAWGVALVPFVFALKLVFHHYNG